MNTNDHDEVIKLIAQGCTFCASCGELSPNLICPECQFKFSQEELDAIWKEYCERERENNVLDGWL